MSEQEDCLSAWPFEDGPDTIAFTTSYVIFDLHPVVHVARDAEGNWQFLSAEGADESQIKTVALKTLLSRHPDLRGIADLAIGWEAWRLNKEAHWSRRRDPDK